MVARAMHAGNVYSTTIRVRGPRRASNRRSDGKVERDAARGRRKAAAAPHG